MLKRLSLPKPASLILVLHGILWLSLALFLDVHPDMADHWLWSKHLHWGYYEHPPMVALTMKLATLIGGNNPLTLKIGSILFSMLILYLAYKATAILFGERNALMTLLLMEASLYFSAASIFWHIDQPYMAFWLLGLMVIFRYVKDQNPNWMFAFGVVAGLGALSKYIMGFFPLVMIFWVIFDKRARGLLKAWQTYVGGALAFLILSPNLYWNHTHDWATFTYNFKKGLTGATLGVHFFAFTLSHVILFSVVFAGDFWIKLFRGKLIGFKPETSDEAQKSAFLFLKLTIYLPTLFFSVASFMGRGADPHWLNISYFAIFMFLGRHLLALLDQGKAKRIKWLFGFSFAVNMALVAFLVVQIRLNPLNLTPAQQDKFAKVYAWEETSGQVREALKDAGYEVPPFVISKEYHIASAFSLYLEEQPDTHTLEKPIRNQWSPVEEVSEKGAFLVCPPEDCKILITGIKERFPKNHIRPIRKIETLVEGKPYRVLMLYYLAGRPQTRPTP